MRPARRARSTCTSSRTSRPERAAGARLPPARRRWRRRCPAGASSPVAARGRRPAAAHARARRQCATTSALATVLLLFLLLVVAVAALGGDRARRRRRGRRLPRSSTGSSRRRPHLTIAEARTWSPWSCSSWSLVSSAPSSTVAAAPRLDARRGRAPRPRRWPALAGRRRRRDDPLPSCSSARPRRPSGSTAVACCAPTATHGWAVEAAAGDAGRPTRRRPTRPCRSATVVLACVGPRPRGRRPRVLDAFAAQLAAALERGGCRPRPPARRQLAAGQRAAHRPAAGGVARPAHAAGVDQGVGVEPAAARRRLVPTTTDEFLEHDRGGDRPAERPRRQPARHEPAPGRRVRSSRRARSGSRRSCRPRSPASAERAGDVDVDVPETLPPGRRRPRAARAGRRQPGRQRRRTRRPSDARCASRPGAVRTGVDLRVIDRGPGIPPGPSATRVPAVPAPRRPLERRRRRPRPGGRPGLRRGDGRRAHLDDTPGGGTTR